jgi:hypothetical protein
MWRGRFAQLEIYPTGVSIRNGHALQGFLSQKTKQNKTKKKKVV